MILLAATSAAIGALSMRLICSFRAYFREKEIKESAYNKGYLSGFDKAKALYEKTSLWR